MQNYVTAPFYDNFMASIIDLYFSGSKSKGRSKTRPSIGSGFKSVSAKDLKAVKVLGITASVYFIAWGPYVSTVVIMSFFSDLKVPYVVR